MKKKKHKTQKKENKTDDSELAPHHALRTLAKHTRADKYSDYKIHKNRTLTEQ